MRKLFEFLKEFAWPFGFCAAIFALATRFTPDLFVPLNVLLAFTTVLVALVITLVGYLVRQQAEHRPTPLKIEQSRESGHLLLVRKNDILGMNMGAQLYYLEGKYERLIAYGVVTNVQSDGIVQLSLRYDQGTDPQLINSISQDVATVRERLIIRAGMIMPSGQVEAGQ